MDIEAVLLERFFLDPGADAPIRSVQITDEDLIDIFGVADIGAAKSMFVSTLPRRKWLTDIFSGAVPPPHRNGRPDFLRILLFLCWMQVTRLRPRGMRDFRQMLEGHLEHHFQHLQGLNPMWKALQTYLAKAYDIELILPDPQPHLQIGQTLRIAFPTWRDRGALRRLKHRMKAESWLDPLEVSNLILSLAAYAGAPPSFRYNFEAWDQARQANDFGACELPFWRAWVAVVSESGGTDQIETIEDEYGDITVQALSPDGRTRPIASFDDSRLSQDVARNVRRGIVLMESHGFGRFRSTKNSSTSTLLVSKARMDGVNEQNTKCIRQLFDGWSLVTFRKSSDIEQRAKATVPSSLGWTGAIRTGTAYLGRVPLTPAFNYSDDPAPVLLLDGEPIPTIIRDNRVELSKGELEGVLSASRAGSRQLRLIAAAVEHPQQRVRVLDEHIEVDEDGVLSGTHPGNVTSDSLDWDGDRRAPCSEFVAITEALYARSSRGLSLAEGVEIIARGLERITDAPSPWDIVKALADSGWFDIASLRNYPARKLVQRRLEAAKYGDKRSTLAVVGPVPIRVEERLRQCAQAVGAELLMLSGISNWAPRFCRVEGESPEAIDEFILRANLNLAPATQAAPALSNASEQISLHHYSVDAQWNAETGTFWKSKGDLGQAGLFRMVSTRETDPRLYAILDGDAAPSVFRSASLAICAFANFRGLPALVRFGNRLRNSPSRIPMPAAWARWIAYRSACTAGPTFSDGKWNYEYPCDASIVEALGKPMSLNLPPDNTGHWGQFLISRSRGSRHVARTDGKLHKKNLLGREMRVRP